MNSKINYALNENQKLVFVDDVPNGKECGCVCPNCGEKLMAKNGGSKREHHFAHLSGTECESAYESMLHLLAKERIRNAFLEKDSFPIQYVSTKFCDKEETCKFQHYGRCEKETKKSFNLKKHYDSCEQEVCYDSIRRRSDLKFFSSTAPERPPIYIEIFVTHACDEEKLHNGERIIETKIESETDIDDIINNGFVEDDCSDDNEKEKTAFYNFRDQKVPSDEISNEIIYNRFVLYPSGKSYTEDCYTSCKDEQITSKIKDHSLLEMILCEPDFYNSREMAKYYGFQRHNIKNCNLCEHYVQSYNMIGHICRLYKTLNIPKDVDTTQAKTCPKFTINQHEMNKQIEKFNKLVQDKEVIVIDSVKK